MNIRFLSCNVSGHSPEGAISGMATPPESFSHLHDEKSHWRRGKTMHLGVAYSGHDCIECSSIQLGSNTVVQDVVSCQALSGWLIPCADSITRVRKVIFCSLVQKVVFGEYCFKLRVFVSAPTAPEPSFSGATSVILVRLEGQMVKV